MSRVGEKPIPVPEGVEIKIENGAISAKGKNGELDFVCPPSINMKHEGGKVTISADGEARREKSLWGTTRARIANLIAGVADGASKTLEIRGVGYRAQMKGDKLSMQLGFSHEVLYDPPPNITIKCPNPNQIVVSGADHQKVGQVASELRAYRPPEPYKGKGVRLLGEYVGRKEGKKKQ